MAIILVYSLIVEKIVAFDTGMEVFLKYIVRMYPAEGVKFYEKVGDRMTAEEQRYIADVLDKMLPPEEKLRLFRNDADFIETVVKEKMTELIYKLSSRCFQP